MFNLSEKNERNCDDVRQQLIDFMSLTFVGGIIIRHCDVDSC